MRTHIERFCAVLVLVMAASCGSPDAPVVVDDQSWDDLSSAQRRAHLESKLEENLERLEEVDDGQHWRAAAQEANRALSLLRVELITEEPAAYAELEARVEALTDNPPPFVAADPAE